MSKASDIAAALAARLTEITVANGYATDIGQRVFRGKRALDADVDVPCVILVEGNDTVQDSTLTGVSLSQRYQFEAHAKCDPDHPNDMAHMIIADLKKAIFTPAQDEPKHGLRLGGRVKQIQYKGRVIGARDDGIDVVFAGIHVDVLYSEELTNP